MSDAIPEGGHHILDAPVSNEWLRLSAFENWMAPKDWEGMALDKDILVPGNKIYGPEFCVFVSHNLNNFLTDSAATRGEWPLGVSFDRQKNRFVAQCCNPFTRHRETIGRFDCPDKAHGAWRRRKHELACKYAEVQNDPRIADALRIRFFDHS